MKVANADTRPLEGQLLYRCTICERHDVWGETWEWFGSEKQLEHDLPFVVVCGEACKAEAQRRGYNGPDLDDDVRRVRR
jgi:hypothetical protein